MLYQDEELVILCSDDGLRILSDSKRWQAKGTFDTAPKMFYQLYILHGLFRSHLIPSAVVLLSGKSENLYKQVKQSFRKLWHLGLLKLTLT